MTDVARFYTLARVAEPGRLLLTGHSHQAWPDVAVDAVADGARAALELLDEKWERAFAQAGRVRAWYGEWIGEPGAEIALGSSTHELVVRMLSALDWRARRRIVTTDGEFHTLRRQLARLAEEGVDVVRVPAAPAATLTERVAAAVDDRTAVVFVSAVLFETSAVVPGLDALTDAARARGAEIVLDAYHALGPVPFTAPRDAWVVGGGYKYLQLGEGNCFLRVPPHAATLRPVVTGWFAEFDALADAHDPDRVAYGRGASRFAGATYDPLSHDRAVAVAAFFRERGWDAATLCASYQRQLGVLADAFDALDLDPAIADRDRSLAPAGRGGFLALRAPGAVALQRALRDRGVLTDARGAWLRLGPAPYLSDEQLRAAVALLGDVARGH